MTTVYLLRHGEIPQVSPRRFVGQSDPPLSEVGRGQAAWWRDHLAGVLFETAVCSDLSRCRETADIVLADCGLKARPDPAWREIRLGAWEGLTVDEVRERFPGEYERRGQDVAGYRPPGGESFADLQARAFAAFTAFADGRQGDILAVTHGGFIRSLLCRLLDMPLANLFRLGQDYAGLTIVTRADGNWRVEAVNLTP